MIYIVTLDKFPNQSIKVELDGKDCNLTFITRDGKLYLDEFSVNGINIINGIVCLNGNNLLSLSKFKGKLYFKDTQGDEDPYFSGLNDRWLLFYEDV